MAYTTIDDPEAYFQIKTYSGTGSSLAVTLDGETDMSPNLVWIKSRSHTNYHVVTDTVRGVTEQIYPNDSGVEETVAGSLTVFGSDGFTVAGSATDTNGSGRTYVAWCWKESADAGFDIVSYTGNGSNRTISHSLSAVPHLMILKSRTYAENWQIYNHKMASDPETDYMEFRTTAIADSAGTWNDTAPTSSVFSVGTRDATNKNTYTYINYLWTAKQGFSKFGAYEGNGSEGGHEDGPFIYTGFAPAWIMMKAVGATDHWRMSDIKRVYAAPLYPHLANVEPTNLTSPIDFLANGFKIRNVDPDDNTDGVTYIYMAFADAPFVNSNGVPCNARST